MLDLAPSLDAALQRALVRLRTVVTIQMTDTVSVSACDGEGPIIDSGERIPPSLKAVTPLAMTLDPFTRQVGWGDTSLRFRADGLVRQLMSGMPIIGKGVTVRVGVDGIPLADYLTEWVGRVTTPLSDTNGEVTLRCADAFAYLTQLQITGGWIAQHPLEIMRQILVEHVPAALWNAASFNFEADTTRSHLSLSRYDARVVSTIAADDAQAAFLRARDRMDRFRNAHPNRPTGKVRLGFGTHSKLYEDSLLQVPQNAWTLFQGLAQVANGTLRLDGQGRLEFAPCTLAGAPVAHLSRSVWSTRGTIDYRGTICNQVLAKASFFTGTSGSVFRENSYAQGDDVTVPFNDAASQAAHGYPGSGIDAVFSKDLENDWLRAVGSLETAISDSDTTMTVHRASELGFTGARYRFGFRGIAGGGIAATSSSIAGNVLTLECAGHWLEDGAYITTSGLDVDVTTPSPVTVIDTDTVTVPLVATDDASNGTGFIAPQQDPLDQLDESEGRVAYLLLRSNPEDPNEYEIVRATAGAPTAGTTATNDPRGSGLGRYTHPDEYDYTIERGALGTTPRAFPAAATPGFTAVFDITNHVIVAQQWLARHAYGAPEVPVTTLLSQLRLQIGDKISADFPDYATPGHEGPEGVVWEVVNKERDRGEVRLILSRVRED